MPVTDLDQPELIATPLQERVRAIAAKRSALAEAESLRKLAADRVKTLQRELAEMVDDLFTQFESGEPLPLIAARNSRDSVADEDAEPVQEAALTGAERRALAMADEPQDDAGDRMRVEMEPLSTRYPGTYIAEEEGPEA